MGFMKLFTSNYYDCVKRCAVTGFIVVWREVLEDSLVVKNTPPRKGALAGYR